MFKQFWSLALAFALATSPALAGNPHLDATPATDMRVAFAPTEGAVPACDLIKCVDQTTPASAGAIATTGQSAKWVSRTRRKSR